MAHSPQRVAAHDVRGTSARGIARLEVERALSNSAARNPAAARARSRPSLALRSSGIRPRSGRTHPMRRSSQATCRRRSREDHRTAGVLGPEFEVDPNVLIPRPETEHLIEVARQRLGDRRGAALQVADVGTGSGCIAVALAREFPDAQIVATDISKAALEVASRNAVRHGVGDRIRMLQTDVLQSLLAADEAPETLFDLIISNPPYIGRTEQVVLATRGSRARTPPSAFRRRARPRHLSTAHPAGRNVAEPRRPVDRRAWLRLGQRIRQNHRRTIVLEAYSDHQRSGRHPAGARSQHIAQHQMPGPLLLARGTMKHVLDPSRFQVRENHRVKTQRLPDRSKTLLTALRKSTDSSCQSTPTN